MTLQLGLDMTQTSSIAKALNVVLADTYALYLKTQNFHWNVVGEKFSMWHALFEEQYSELAGAIDEIAERIRTLGHAAPGSFGEFSSLTSLEDASTFSDGVAMIQVLVADHQVVIKSIVSAVDAAEKAKDNVTVDFLNERLAIHQKTVWMLNSHLS